MTRRTTVLIACDGCGTTRQGRVGERLGSLRQRLLEVGWHVDDAKNEDHCGTCAESVVLS